MNHLPTVDPKSTLREHFLRSKQPIAKPAPSGPTPGYTPPADPLYKRLRCDVAVTFLSGRTLSGKLVSLGRYAFEIETAEGRHHVMKHAVEQVLLEPGVRP